MSDTLEERYKRLIDGNFVSMTVGRTLKEILQQRYAQLAKQDDKNLGKIAVYMTDMPPQIRETFTFELMLFLDSLILAVGYTIAAENQRTLALARDLFGEPGQDNSPKT
jgi:hypothetical protein